MDITYAYTKIRKNFGRQPMFCEVPVHLLDSIDPDPIEQKRYGLRNPVHRDAQASLNQSEHYINTKRVVLQDSGANHGEGGWPKEVNFWDEEMTTRYKRRVERDDNYVDAVLGTYSNLEHFIKQNNAIEMYEMYFSSMKPEKPLEKSMIRLSNVYKDPFSRPISSIAWTNEDDSKMVISYCNRKYPITGPVNSNYTCYMWDLENPNSPYLDFNPPAACWSLVCSPVNPSVIVAGINDGRVCMFDVRTQKEPLVLSPMHLAHRDPVTAVIYLQSRLNTEFLSASTDGKVVCWDIRNVSQPMETVLISVRIPPGDQVSHANSEGISVLQFEKTIPTKYLCGTDTGLVVNVNRKGKTHQDMMSTVFHTQLGPVKALHRNPSIVKLFLTCGDWTINFWSEDIHMSPIITGLPQRYQPNDVAWSPQRPSGFMAVTAEGNFQYWDLLRKYRDPMIIVPLTKAPLLKLKPNEEGRLVAVGDFKGATYLLTLSDNLVQPEPKDKQLLSQVYDRETKREHILESRIKEIMLKRKAEEEGGVAVVEEVVDEEALTRAAEEEYRKGVQEEVRRTGYSLSSGARGPDKQRKR